MALNDLVDSFCYSQKNTRQKGLILVFVGLLCLLSEPCNATWTVYLNSNVFGGIRLSTANSVTSCLQGCNTNMRCRGADYNSANPVGWRCFLQFSAAARIHVGTISGVLHYSISRLCPGTTKTTFLCYGGRHLQQVTASMPPPPSDRCWRYYVFR